MAPQLAWLVRYLTPGPAPCLLGVSYHQEAGAGALRSRQQQAAPERTRRRAGWARQDTGRYGGTGVATPLALACATRAPGPPPGTHHRRAPPGGAGGGGLASGQSRGSGRPPHKRGRCTCKRGCRRRAGRGARRNKQYQDATRGQAGGA